ncbi:MAG: cardiolipin synthase [Eubacteriales bacterium]|nr:cardiolipin synthase [Eubacteriales bacterium]
MKYADQLLRYIILALGAIAEVIIVITIANYFSTQAVWIGELLRIAGGVICVYIINNTRHMSMDIIWILMIFFFPISGTMVYLLMGANLFHSETAKKLHLSDIEGKKYLQQDSNIFEKLTSKLPSLKGDFHYITKSSGYPFYQNTGFDYYGLGDLGFPVMLEEMEKAESFIFLEYFIIEEGFMWESMHEILKRKAKEGLDVRVMYDDAGSIGTLKASYSRQLESEGIKCVRFNKLNPFLGPVMNHRDHRKILVIDGKVAFSGGINLADEYINKKQVYGHWKDNCIRITGEAVWSYTVLFLSNWNALRKTDEDYEFFKRESLPGKPDGFIAPYGGTPLSKQFNVGQNIYTNIINSATDYVYICTPYLIIDTELENALILAAQKGVKVVMLTPGIPDKKMVWWITRSFYKNLIEAGIKIYEYTPGFVHAKVFVSDDRVATVGTFNLDFRSLYLHFENGTYLCDSKKVFDIRDDFLNTLEVSHLMEQKDVKNGLIKRCFIGIAKLFVSQM